MPNVLLGVTGSVAAYRAADLARELMRAGCTVRTCLSDGAQGFVKPALFEALTGQPSLNSVFEEPVPGRMAHIDWARWADLVLIAPASADTLAAAAHGLGRDMLQTLLLAYDGPTLYAPAMNPTMFTNPAVIEARRVLESRGAHFVEPAEGDVACGEQGQGKLAAISAIVEAALTILNAKKLWEGKTVLITSGPTQEPIDAVRYISNRSSGKMGIALARAALMMGAKVILVTGPTAEIAPSRAETLRVKTAREMLDAAHSRVGEADVVIGAAAVADYHPAEVIPGKMRRAREEFELKLVKNPDVLAALTKAAKPGAKVIGFAAEPDEGLESAAEKIKAKGIAGIAVNDISRSDVGFETEENSLTFVRADGVTAESGKRSKLGCGLWLLERLAEI
ncbi:MAG TPA: bifunctional phosphopantothenoylcysteine decarboxylase/phosphopantothenate--cysteine ligase CoaBC [Fimbriimonadaceae bacterium]|nr:bifunctional phosphopantothenoylcysteine decarboxylase/phosphopantothenate--cysteine ligase CoaBC [Fimbriimonadaceae bacterium]